MFRVPGRGEIPTWDELGAVARAGLEGRCAELAVTAAVHSHSLIG